MSRYPGSYAGLTVAQADLLSFLREREDEGKTPSFQEMQDHLGLASKSGVHRLITALEKRGYIQRRPFEARSLTCNAFRDLALIDTPKLIAELSKRGFQFYGMSGGVA